jgi:hypothetical protein
LGEFYASLANVYFGQLFENHGSGQKLLKEKKYLSNKNVLCYILCFSQFRLVTLVPGLVHPGDIILEANGREVKDPEKLQKAIEDSGEFIVFKIQPSNADLNGGIVLSPQTSIASKESKVLFSKSHNPS